MPPIILIGVSAAAMFAVGVGISVLVGGVDGTPLWMRAVAIGIGMWLATAYTTATVEWALDGRSVKQIRKHIAAHRFRDAAVELHVYVKQLEKLCGSYDPLTLRWMYTQAHVLLHTGQRMRAMALLALVLDGQLTTLGPYHPDTRRSLRLLERHTDVTAPIAPVETWWRD